MTFKADRGFGALCRTLTSSSSLSYIGAICALHDSLMGNDSEYHAAEETVSVHWLVCIPSRMGGATIGPGGDMTPPLSDAGGTGGDIIWE